MGIDDGGSTVSKSFWNLDTSGVATSDGGTGKTTVQMEAESTFTDVGWNFTNIWNIDGPTNAGHTCALSTASHTMPTAPHQARRLIIRTKFVI